MMSKPSNPFIYGGPVDTTQFVGRDTEVNRVFDQLGSHARGSVAIIGERRIGKTSLLHYVSAPDVIKRWNLDETQSISIYQDCGGISPFTVTRFWKTILRRVRRALKQKKLETSLLEAVQELLGSDEITTLDIEFLLDDFHEAGLLLVLMLDEFEWLVRTDPQHEAMTRDFLAGLRALINHVPRVLSLIVATRQPLDEVCQDIRFMGSPFYNNFVFVHLRPFTHDEAELLFKQMLARSGITFSKAEKDYIYGLAGTHPLLLQTAAALVFDFKAAGAREIQEMFPIREQFRELVEHQFEDFWKWSRPKERQILIQLASSNAKAAMAKLRTWADERQTLLRRGLISQSPKKSFRFFSPVYREWLTENLYRLGANEWLDEQEIDAVRESVATSPTPPVVFISYSHKDEVEKEALLVHLGVLHKGTSLIDLWSDDRLGGGDYWEEEIMAAMAQARVAILLISANFLNSEFILGKEVPTLLQRRESEGVTIIPVIAKSCAWRQIEWLAKMNVRPKNGNPVWRSGGKYTDEELTAIAEEVAAIIKRN